MRHPSTRRGPSSLRALRRAGALLAGALLLGSCGGGSGGGGPSDDAPGAIAGTLLVADANWGGVGEAEPNGSLAQAQTLPPFQPGATLRIAGEAGAVATRYGAVDTTDAFRLACAVDQDVTLTLTASTDGVAQGNFDLAVFEVGSGASLGSAATANNPEVLVVTLAADEPVDVVVTCASGSGAYVLRLQGTAPLVAASRRSAPVGTPSGEAVSYLLDEAEAIEGRLVLRTGADRAGVEALASEVGARVLRRASSGSYVLAFDPEVAGTACREAIARAARLASRPGVAFAEPDWRVRACSTTTNDPHLGRQWNLRGVGAPAAWDTTLGNSGVVVGLIDTGVVAHPDLSPQVSGGYDFVSDVPYSGDGDGRDPDPTDPGDLAEIDGRSDWHGSHVAGIAVARANDGVGVAGVAPGCRFMPLRALGVDGGSVTDVADALRYAAGLDGTDHGGPLAAPLRIVNMSLGVPVDALELRHAVADAHAAGVLLVASVGNSGAGVLYPAAYDEVLAVAAVDGRLQWASYSNVGADVDLAAPGGDDARDVGGDGFPDAVLSCTLDETVVPTTPSWGYESGTSMSAPHVSGAAALLFSVDPSLTAAQCRQILLATCRDLDVAGNDPRTGAGLLQVGEAVRVARAGAGQPHTAPPSLLLSSRALRIVSDETVATVYLMNGGGGTLQLDVAPTVDTDSGLPWLSAFTVAAPGGAATNRSEVVVLADRTGLATGLHAGSVTLTSAGQALGTIRVLLEVGDVPLSGEGLLLSVVAQEEGSGRVARSGFAYPWDDYRYVLSDLPPGNYTILAGTDLDADGFFCETDDWCGEHGGAPPTVVTVPPGVRVTGVNVTLTR